MKTITEFSGILLQRAAEVQRAFLAAHPQPAPVAASEPAPAEPTAEADAQAESPGNDVPAAAEGEAPAADGGAAEAAPAEAPAVEWGTGPEAEAVGEALAVSGDRLARLMQALDVVGRRVGQVRLVRVLQGEPPPQGALKSGDFYFAVDLAPRPRSAESQTDDRDDRRRGGGRDRDRGRRPGDRGPGGPRGAGGPPGKGGKFSNDRPGRDADMREGRGEMPRAGAGWMLTRAPDDRRGRDEAGAERRDRRPPRGPRADGPRPPLGARGDRPPRGPRPDRGGGGPGFPRRDGGAGRPPGAPGAPRPVGAAPAGGAEDRRPRGPRRPEGPAPHRDDRNWSGRRRGGWDEPAVPETAAPVAPAEPEAALSAAPESAAPVEALAASAAESSGPVNTPTPTDNG